MSDFLLSNWQQLLSPAIQLFGAVIQLFGIVLGVIIVAWQVRKQLKEQAARQSAQARDELLVMIYDSFSAEIKACKKKVTEASIKILSCPDRIESYWLQKKQLDLQKPTPISDRSEALSRLNFEVRIALAEVISVIERYDIVFPKQRLFRAFKSALIMQSHSRAETFQAFWSKVRAFLPIDVPKAEQAALGLAVIETRPPAAADYEKMRELAEAHLYESTEITGCLIDLLHEAQNNLLGHLFQRQILPRIPRKDSRLSVRDDDAVLARIEERVRVWEEQFNPESREEDPNGNDLAPESTMGQFQTLPGTLPVARGRSGGGWRGVPVPSGRG